MTSRIASAVSPNLLAYPAPSPDEANNQRGWKSDIARRMGVSRATVTYVFNGRNTSARIARAIVEATGKTHAELWPGKYPEAEFLEAMAAHKSGESA